MNKFTLLFFISLFSYAGTMAANEAILMSCSHNAALSSDSLSKVVKHRDSAFQTCLTCNKGDCSMKRWTEENKDGENLCKLLFCTPKKISKSYEVPADSPRGKSSFTYSYSISKKGRMDEINILSVEGSYKRKDALKYLKSLTKRTEYEPLTHENKKYKVTNLTSEMTVNLMWENE